MIVIGQEVVEWVASRTGEFGNFGCAVGFGIEREGKLIGGVVFNDFNGKAMQIHTAAESPHWLNRKFLWMIFDYAFNQAKVKVLLSVVGEGNTHAAAFVLHVGFSECTRIPDAHPLGDVLIRTMRKDACKFLRKPYAP